MAPPTIISMIESGYVLYLLNRNPTPMFAQITSLPVRMPHLFKSAY